VGHSANLEEPPKATSNSGFAELCAENLEEQTQA